MTTIGISGASASGKSLLAESLLNVLKFQNYTASVVHLDQYFLRDPEHAPTLRSSILGGRFINFNHPGVIDRNAVLQKFDSRQDDFLILEGHLLFSIPEIRARLDSKIFLDIPKDISLARRLLRDLDGKRMSSDPKFIVNYYLLSAAKGYSEWIEPSREYSDYILDGTVLPEDLTIMAMTLIQNRTEGPLEASANSKTRCGTLRI